MSNGQRRLLPFLHSKRGTRASEAPLAGGSCHHSRAGGRFSRRNIHPEGQYRVSPARGGNVQRTKGAPPLFAQQKGDASKRSTARRGFIPPIPAQTDASADGTSIQRSSVGFPPLTGEMSNGQRGLLPFLHSKRGTRASEAPLAGGSCHHSRANGRFSGRNIHPEGSAGFPPLTGEMPNGQRGLDEHSETQEMPPATVHRVK